MFGGIPMSKGAKPVKWGASSAVHRAAHSLWSLLLGVMLLVLTPGKATAEIQFEAFLGYDGVVRDGNWFPAAFEVFNDGPSFSGVIEVYNDQGGKSQARRVPVELPTNTRKRIVIPAFGSAGVYSQWKAVLLDEKGKKRAEARNSIVRRTIDSKGILIGGVAQSFSGLPILPDPLKDRSDLAVEVVRLEAAIVPENPLALDALKTIYLNSVRALELSSAQGAALISWVNRGGHLVVAVDQAGDFAGLPWLAPLLPVKLGGASVVGAGTDLETFSYGTNWSLSKLQDYRRAVKKLENEDEFRQAKFPIFQAELRDGKVLVQAGVAPLVVQANRGRGMLTVLTFAPEKEPFRSWKGRGWFWAQLNDMPAEWFTDKKTNNSNNYASKTSIDGVIGAMIDSKQVRKLPVSWLLILLAVYLVVIGPLDQWWLKKINRQMLTWITFPCYVIGFSLLIYWIGFMLRAGESELNEVHMVDVMPGASKAELRGRTYVSIYSPSNSRYPVGTDIQYATLRGEFQASYGAQEMSRMEMTQLSKGFAAEVAVPVWTSQMFISDWVQPAADPLNFKLSLEGDKLVARAENKSKKTVNQAWVVANGRVYNFPKMVPGERQQMTLASGTGQRLEDFVRENASNFGWAAQQRRNAFGDSRNNLLPNMPAHLAAASFISQLRDNSGPYNNNNFGGFQGPDGFDLSERMAKGKACLLAWTPDFSPIPDLNKFDPRRVSRDTLFRVMTDIP